MKTKLILIAAGALTSLACSSGDPVNIGENAPVKTGEFLSDYAASWDGYVEAYDFDSGSDRVRMTLDESGEGYIEVGDMPLLPPPSDPDAGYGMGSYDKLSEGFHYTVRNAMVESARIQLDAHPEELFKEWCELQTPVLWEGFGDPADPLYMCLPNTPTMGGGNGCFIEDENGENPTPINCTKLGMCQDPSFGCDCTADGCTILDPPAGLKFRTHLDAALDDDGESLVGTLVIGDSHMTIRLERQ
jgi:hypothetical protein